MATFLDLSLFGHVSSVFIFLFVFLIVYAFLGMSKIFKDIGGHNGIYAIIALAIAFMSSFSKGFTSVIMTMAPWFTVIIVFLFLAFFVVRMFTSDETFISDLMNQPAIRWVLIIIFVVILLVSISNSFGQQVLDDGTGNVPSGESSSTQIDNNEVVYESTPASAQTEGVATDDFSTNMTQTLFHPKVLGMMLIIFISFFTILLIARTSDPAK